MIHTNYTNTQYITFKDTHHTTWARQFLAFKDTHSATPISPQGPTLYITSTHRSLASKIHTTLHQSTPATHQHKNTTHKRQSNVQLGVVIQLGLDKEVIHGEEKHNMRMWSVRLYRRFELNSRNINPHVREYLYLEKDCHSYTHVFVKLIQTRPDSLLS
jgi:hypothetical protein